jgi:hypothetical protein
MSTLESISVSKVLAQIPINTHSAEALDKFVLEYLQYRPSVLDTHLENRVLYHVFIREEDPYENHMLRYSDMEFVRSFATKTAAVEWIKEQGPDIIDYEENDNRGRPVVMMIIPVTNNSEFELYALGGPCHLYGISHKCFSTFAFSKMGYEMCLREHKSAISYDCTDIIPWWITYFHGDTIIRGCTIDHIHDLHSSITYSENDMEKKHPNLDRYHLVINNPDAFITSDKNYTEYYHRD